MLGGDIPDLVLDRPAWMDDAACAGQGTDRYFASNTAAAKATCAECSVKSECLEWALPDESLFGTWGGTSHLERRVLRRTRAA